MHADSDSADLARLKEELEEAHAQRDEWREARNYCGSCGKTMSEAGLCNPCSKRAGNERGELIERKDELAAALRRAEKKLKAAEVELSRLEEEKLVLLRLLRATTEFRDHDLSECRLSWTLNAEHCAACRLNKEIEQALSSGDSE